ncbi:MAG: hypothetical protein MI757_02385 [Pirellulales bacterium]|nr:hypothetical protein [Pirellulales bacterium]
MARSTSRVAGVAAYDHPGAPQWISLHVSRRATDPVVAIKPSKQYSPGEAESTFRNVDGM